MLNDGQISIICQNHVPVIVPAEVNILTIHKYPMMPIVMEKNQEEEYCQILTVSELETE